MTHFPSSAFGEDPFSIIPFHPSYDLQVNQLLDAAFGLDRQQKSSYKLRETCQKIDDLSLLMLNEDQTKLLATIAYWQLDVAGQKALLLGPLAVHPDYQGQGLGKYLMDETLKLAQKIAALRGWQFTILIGDLDYYEKSGFSRVPLGAIDYPQPTDPKRVLFYEFAPNSLQNLIDNNGLPLPLNQLD